MSQQPPQRKPWPMKWIVVAILVCVIPYTLLTLRYRKPNPAYQPYHDMKERAQVKRLLDSQFRRVQLDFQPLEFAPSQPEQPTSSEPGGVPARLREVLIDPPVTPLEIRQVWTTRASGEISPLVVEFAYRVNETTSRLLRVTAYLHEGDLLVIPELDRSGAGAPRESTEYARAEIPPGLLDANTTVTLVGATTSRRWVPTPPPRP